MRVTIARTFLIAALVVTGCSDGPLVTEQGSQPPRVPSVFMTAMRGTVDLAAGTLTFRPVPRDTPSLLNSGNVSAQIYGNQGTTVQLYNSPVTVTNPSAPGKKTYSADVGIRNLLAHPIGDEQAGIAPTDTMGIYVFINSGPTVVSTSSACSPACTVTAVNTHGILQFTAVAEKYWHWPERLGAAGSPTDTTLLRKTWVFEADVQVTVFSFDVLISAAWPPPNESRWKIAYQGDSVPDLHVEPLWRRITTNWTGGVFLNTPGPQQISIRSDPATSFVFVRHDSLGSTQDAYLLARVRNEYATTVPDVSFGMDDDVKFMAVGLTGTQVGFLNGSFGFLGTPITANTNLFHTYEIRKFAADSVQLWRDGVRIAGHTYASLGASIPSQPYGFYWGPAGVGLPPLTGSVPNRSNWDHVIYEIGVTQP